MLEKRDIPSSARNFQVARKVILTPDKEVMMEFGEFRQSSADSPSFSDDSPNFYVANWNSKLESSRLLIRPSPPILETLALDRLPPGNWRFWAFASGRKGRLQFDIVDNAAGAFAHLVMHLSDVAFGTDLEFMRLDGPLFGFSYQNNSNVATICFASFYYLPIEVMRLWNVSEPSVGRDLTSDYLEGWVKEATKDFPKWSPEMHEKVYGKE